MIDPETLVLAVQFRFPELLRLRVIEFLPHHPICLTGALKSLPPLAWVDRAMFTGISLHGGAGFAWRCERQGPDRIVYRMDRDIRELRFKSSNGKR